VEYSKKERLEEFFRRLLDAPPANNVAEARTQLTTFLNEVEDEMTSIPYDPSNWQLDGRLYPPMDDSIREVSGRKDVVRFMHFRHNTFIRDNGAIEIQERLTRRVVLQKNGADGKGVWDS
jgi:hypothetical protein